MFSWQGSNQRRVRQGLTCTQLVGSSNEEWCCSSCDGSAQFYQNHPRYHRSRANYSLIQLLENLHPDPHRLQIRHSNETVIRRLDIVFLNRLIGLHLK